MWQLKVNINKCNVSSGNYTFNCGDQVADFDIIVGQNLALNECASEAFSRSFLIFKGLSSRNSQLLV